MKKIIVSIIVIGTILTSIPTITIGENELSEDKIILDYAFDTPVIKNIVIADTIYNQIEINNAPNSGNPGEPRLPTKGAYILIPQGKKVSSIIVTYDEVVNLGSGFVIEPVGQSVPLSEIDSASFPLPDENIYSSDEAFPGKLVTKVGKYSCKGYELLVLRLHPVQYVPTSGDLFYYPDLTVSVETVEGGSINDLYRGLEKDKQDIEVKVENPSIIDTYELQAPNVGMQSQTYGLLIITSDAFKDGFLPLKQAHDNDGLNTLIVTVEDIYSSCSGVDNAEKVRNFIKQAYTTYGIDFVLLGGDSEIVPTRYLTTGGENVLKQILSDLYYGGLDGTWNLPEEPYPSDKDISIEDIGTWGFCTGNMTGPYVDNANYIEGDSSMRCDFIGGGPSNDKHYLRIRFINAIDLTKRKYINFQFNLSRSDLIDFNSYGIDVNLKDRKGFTPNFQIRQIWWPTKHDGDDGWLNLHFNWRYGFDDVNPFFNPRAVKEIYFKIDTINATCNDYIRIDGLYFSKHIDECWGETGEKDNCAEVYVGRACVDNNTEVQNFVNKTISYMNTEINDEYLKKVLLVGEHLGFGGIARWGGNYVEELIGICSNHGYVTQGFSEDIFNFTRLYDKFWEENGWEQPFLGEGGWPKQDLINLTNQNFHVINHMGHANPSINMKMNCTDVVTALNNTKYCFIYSQGCSAGNFEKNNRDCIAEAFTVETPHGAFAGIWNSDSGWGKRNSTDGDSQKYHREFWDAFFKENISSIGKANQDSKEDNLWQFPLDEWDIMEWIYYELNLFGDPALEFPFHCLNEKPDKPDTPAGPTTGDPGVEYEYTTCATDPEGHPIQYGWDWDDIGPIEWTDFYASGETVNISHSWSFWGSRSVRVKARDIFGEESEWSDPLYVSLPISYESSQFQSQESNPQSTPMETENSSPTSN